MACKAGVFAFNRCERLKFPNLDAHLILVRQIIRRIYNYFEI